MTRDDIIRMARECWPSDRRMWSVDADLPRLERFAALVAAAEREHMIKDGWRQCAKGQRTTQFCGQLEQALLAEREACAKVCDERADADGWEGYYANQCAAAIRARGQE